MRTFHMPVLPPFNNTDVQATIFKPVLNSKLKDLVPVTAPFKIEKIKDP